MRSLLVRTLVVVVMVGCSAHYQDYAPMMFPDLDQNGLDLKGKSLLQFTEMLQDADATNIHVAHGMGPGGETIDAVAADYLYHVYIFIDGVYLDRTKIACDPGRAAVHPTVKVVGSGKQSALVLIAEVMTVDKKRAGMLVLFDEKGVTKTTPLPLNVLIEKHRGLRDPYIGGTSMTQGILLTARDDSGAPWTKIYVLKLEGSKLDIEDVPYSRGFACSCFTDWLDGKDGRLLSGEVLD